MNGVDAGNPTAQDHGADAPTETLDLELRDAYDVLASGAAQILPAGGLAEQLLVAKREQRPLRVKLGIDPSGSI